MLKRADGSCESVRNAFRKSFPSCRAETAVSADGRPRHHGQRIPMDAKERPSQDGNKSGTAEV